ncbi:DUF1801 domain-containing protein [Candidatus Saccharibacteria bacterium]|nr:DUF1801 domain-containing protein [Candidatus Saccharibacteria bacterium]
MNKDITDYNAKQTETDKDICDLLAQEINKNLTKQTENKIWHGHPVWFIDGNPIVGYSKQKAGIRLMFWSGVSFSEPDLTPGTGKFKDASITYTTPDKVNTEDLHRWLEKSVKIQWDYKNIVKKRGQLDRL